ncbi:1-acyl-sn-glycerol-3-phosphate acyltransferase [Corynebacterium tuberculostearicum]|uniref:lysophospholipid acyltransferase family protein n=1 Tax=Corynebacterium TaxID=1716 RepID=UPI001EF206D6|nr:MULTISPECIES: lysophospholipid acyltransferase family protein [Corynebacterium]MCG7461077.1 1-acyl-sn-glycerol-3-phosphate acyltransferase [Corynebacterium sp. ACRPF]MDV2417062.1 lysophospholipid acyltransferase family protein [Corynebacterium tuberculostearicum]
MKNKWYWAFKHIFFGPALQVWNRPWSEGIEKIPAEGPAILVSNHQAVMDSFFFPLMCPRQITFPAKSEYFTTPGLVGSLQKWFFTSVGQVPIERDSEDAGDAIVETAEGILSRGDLFGIYPEGTRSPDGRVYKGRTGMGRIAMETNQPVFPIAMINSRKANPIGSWIPRPFKVGVRVGDPIWPHDWAKERGMNPAEHETIRAFTDFMMRNLAELSDKPYVDVYASDVKASLKAGHGYPAGAEYKGR